MCYFKPLCYYLAIYALVHVEILRTRSLSNTEILVEEIIKSNSSAHQFKLFCIVRDIYIYIFNCDICALVCGNN